MLNKDTSQISVYITNKIFQNRAMILEPQTKFICKINLSIASMKADPPVLDFDIKTNILRSSCYQKK